jgi:hypothetical protein
VPSPNVGNGGNYLSSVYAIAPNDVWAVGWYYHETMLVEQTLTLHWDGNTWSVVPSPNAYPNSNYLNEITATAGNDVWAVGSYLLEGRVYQTLTMRWNGSAWSVVPSANANSSVDNYLYGVTAVAANDIWAVGHYGFGTTFQTITAHWDGSAWTIVPSPNPGGNNFLFGVTAASANDVYAVGRYDNGSVDRTLIEHWNGSAWSVVPSPNIGSLDNGLEAAAAVSSNDVWAVGASTEGTVSQTLVERYNPCPPSPTPVTPTSTPQITTTPTSETGTPQTTATPTSLTNTPTPQTIATATPCAIQFTDVPQDHTFYAFIRCLACRGIISGYSDGTFKPGNDVTRGQLSKIVANAAGFIEPVSGQTFTDVPPSHTFYEFIERMADRGIVGGYSDPAVCAPDGVPCFKPGNNATRGHISKIVANAANFTEPVSGQTFTDVPPSHTFYEFIERIAARGIIGGYSDPAVCSPDGVPCFKPGNNATRGQTSKIVANTFFPECNP